MSNKDIWGDTREATNNFAKFNKIGDFIKGTLVDVRKIKSKLPGKENKMTTVYELLSQVGEFHDAETTVDDSGNKQVKIVEPAIAVGEGEYWMIGGKDEIDGSTGKVEKPGLTGQMRNVKKGQIVGFRFDSVQPSKTAGFAPAKIVKVLIGGMDPNYMGQTSADVNPNDEEIPM